MKHLGLVGLLLAVGCGGGAPVSDNKRVGDLDSTEVRELCQYWIDQVGPPREISCPDGEITSTGGLGDLAECEEEIGEMVAFVSDDCGLEVGDLDDCIAAIAEASDAQICANAEPAACERLEPIFESCEPDEGGGGDDDGTPPPDDGI